MYWSPSQLRRRAAVGGTDRVRPFTQMTPGAVATRARALTIGAPGRGDREAVHPPCLGHSVRFGVAAANYPHREDS
jgi:hypothetical protein